MAEYLNFVLSIFISVVTLKVSLTNVLQEVRSLFSNPNPNNNNNFNSDQQVLGKASFSQQTSLRILNTYVTFIFLY